MAKDKYGNEVNVGDYVVATTPHYRDNPGIYPVVSVGEKAVTILISKELKRKSWWQDGGMKSEMVPNTSVRCGFVRITEEMAKQIMGDKFNAQ